MKRLVVFSTGPGTSRARGRDDQRRQAPARHPGLGWQGVRQLVHYVSASPPRTSSRGSPSPSAPSASASATASARLPFLCETYEDGDEIYLIGFSRGAFQARSLAGLIALAACPWLRRRRSPMSGTTTSRTSRAGPGTAGGAACGGALPGPHQVRGRMGHGRHLGIPFIRKGAIKELFGFHDTQLSPLVDVGLHALAIDEPRGPFAPTFWTVRQGRGAARRARSSSRSGSRARMPMSVAAIKDCALSDIALLWMAERMGQTTGLAVDLEALRKATKPDPLGELLSPTSDGIYRVSYLLPLRAPHRAGPQGHFAITAIAARQLARRRAPSRRADRQREHRPKRDAHFGKRAPLRRGEALNRRKYRPMSLASVVRKRKRTR